MKRVVLTGVALAVVAAALPATASALSRAQANAIALRVLRPQAIKRNVILFGLPSPLAAGRAVFPADPPKGSLGRPVRIPITRLRHAAWLYWLDEFPYAKFSHLSRYLLVDDLTSRVVSKASIGWYPTIDGRRPGFLATRKSYESKRYRVYTKVAARKTAAVPPPVSFSWPLANIPPGALKGECVLIVSDYSDQNFLNDYTAFREWAGTLKIPTFFATGNGPQQDLPRPDTKPPSGGDLRDSTTSLIVKDGCKDILLYMTGHGLDQSHGPPTVVTKVQYAEGATTAEATPTGITAADVASALSAHPHTNFKLKIDSCFSGRFVEELTTLEEGGHRASKFKNLLIAEVSSPATLPSTFAITALDGNSNPNHLSEFTNQNLTGLEMFFASNDEITQAVNQGDSLIAHALDRATELGFEANHAAQDLGIYPIKVTNFNAEPRVTPIHAVFDPATFSTTYTEDAVGRNLHYTWSVSIPTDPDCPKGFKGNSPQPNQATWQHKDVSQGGFCNHTGTAVGPRGHPGTVTVQIFNADWNCTATYQGTEGDKGSKVGDGPAPGPCTKK